MAEHLTLGLCHADSPTPLNITLTGNQWFLKPQPCCQVSSGTLAHDQVCDFLLWPPRNFCPHPRPGTTSSSRHLDTCCWSQSHSPLFSHLCPQPFLPYVTIICVQSLSPRLDGHAVEAETLCYSPGHLPPPPPPPACEGTLSKGWRTQQRAPSS